MEALAVGETFLFEAFRLDRRGLFRRDERGMFVPVAIGSRGFEVLRVLIAAHGDLVTKDEIMAAVWPGTVVEDNNLTVQMSALRRILDRASTEGSCIQTVAGRGYRFVPAVTRSAGDSAISPTRVAVIGTRPSPPLSIVVLPFTNLSNDPDQEYFADGITDDLTTDLSRISGSFVIARGTAFTYKGKAVDGREVGRELGVRYALEGSVRRSGNQVRVNAQLIDAETGAHLWAERFDRDTRDLFALQDEITSRIANALDIELIVAEAARPIDHPDALDYILRGRATALEAYNERVSLFEHALALDPHSIDAQSWLARALAGRVLDGMSDTPTVDITRAEGLVGRALAASPRSALAHYAKGQILRAQDRYDEAIPEYETVLVFIRNWADAIASLGWCRFFTGSIEGTIPLLEQAICVSPRDPAIGYWYFRIANAYLVQSRIDDAIVWARKARSANPGNPRRYALLAAAYALKGQTEHAAAELAEARKLTPDDRFSSLARLKAVEYFGVSKVSALFEVTLFAGLRKAGMPEE